MHHEELWYSYTLFDGDRVETGELCDGRGVDVTLSDTPVVYVEFNRRCVHVSVEAILSAVAVPQPPTGSHSGKLLMLRAMRDADEGEEHHLRTYEGVVIPPES